MDLSILKEISLNKIVNLIMFFKLRFLFYKLFIGKSSIYPKRITCSLNDFLINNPDYIGSIQMLSFHEYVHIHFETDHIHRVIKRGKGPPIPSNYRTLGDGWIEHWYFKRDHETMHREDGPAYYEDWSGKICNERYHLNDNQISKEELNVFMREKKLEKFLNDE